MIKDLYDLSGKTTLVTGATSGLGKQFARILHEAGSRVILVARGRERLEGMAKELSNSMILPMNVGEKSSVKEAFAELESRGEKIDVCINNAGIGMQTPIFEEDEENLFESQIQTNVMGVWYVTHAVANHMKNHKIAGSIINIGSIRGGAKQKEGFCAYATSKAAVMKLTESLVGELGPHNIRINCINPGVFHTPLTDYRLNTKEKKQEIASKNPLGFVADVEDMDGMILYLASNKASRYVNGSIFTIDGGRSWGGDVPS